MTGFFTESNLEGLRVNLGALHADIRAAVKVAGRKAFAWASREAAKGMADAAGIPYSAARKRTKAKGRVDASGRVWFGLNAVSAKYLKASDKRGTFTSKKMDGHRFKRVGQARLPIQKIEKKIEEDSMQFIEGEFLERIEEKIIEEFFSAMDANTGRPDGASRAIVGL